MTSIEYSRTNGPERRVTGWHVLAILVASFVIVAGVNAYMIHAAISTFPGVTDDEAYEHGLSYDRDIAEAQAQQALGWRVEAHVTRLVQGRIALDLGIKDQQGSAVRGLDVVARLEFEPDEQRDVALAATEAAPGIYRAEAAALPGHYVLDVAASLGGETAYRSRNRINVN